ncbi:MAG: hypothetical protein R3B72_47420 [Polyangiaceae bacterium]
MIAQGVLALGACLSAGCLSAGCLSEDPPPQRVLPMGVLGDHPIDTTKKGELGEGTAEAFGLRLPRGLTVESKSTEAMVAVGRLRLEDVSNYLRPRLAGGEVETGPTKTLFKQAKVKGGDREVDVTLSLVRRGLRVMVVDRTRLPAPEGISTEEWWRRSGLTPDGKVLKTHAQ